MREYYRNSYTVSGARRAAALAAGDLVHDAGFADWSRVHEPLG